MKRQYSDEEFEELGGYSPDVSNMKLSEACEILDNADIDYEIMGDDSDDINVITQIPPSGDIVPKGGKVILYTEESGEGFDVEVPDFNGRDISDAEYLASISGVQIEINGTGVDYKVNYQNVEAGKKVRRGTVITLTMVEDVITETYIE